MGRLVKSLAALLLLVASPYSSAIIVDYTFSGTSSTAPPWEVSAVFSLDDGDITPGANLVPFFTDWSISWTNGTDTLTNNSASSTLIGGSVFVVDALLTPVNVFLCTDTCGGGGANWPEAILTESFWDASITPAGNCCVGAFGPATGEWSSGPVASVPAPATFSLLVFGVAVLGWTRRQKVLAQLGSVTGSPLQRLQV